jgi:hypothetical protein
VVAGEGARVAGTGAAAGGRRERAEPWSDSVGLGASDVNGVGKEGSARADRAEPSGLE